MRQRQRETEGERERTFPFLKLKACARMVFVSGLWGKASSMLCPLGKRSECVFGLHSRKRSCTCEEKLRELPVPVALGLGAVGSARGTRATRQDCGQRPVGKAEARVASWGEDSGLGEDSGQGRAPWPCAWGRCRRGLVWPTGLPFPAPEGTSGCSGGGSRWHRV